MVDTHALGACASRREGSSPFRGTNVKTGRFGRFLRWFNKFIHIPQYKYTKRKEPAQKRVRGRLLYCTSPPERALTLWLLYDAVFQDGSHIERSNLTATDDIRIGNADHTSSDIAKLLGSSATITTAQRRCKIALMRALPTDRRLAIGLTKLPLCLFATNTLHITTHYSSVLWISKGLFHNSTTLHICQ